MKLNQEILNDYISYLKKEKYKNLIQDLKLEYCTDDENYIHLILIKIKKSQRKKGYGNALLSDIVQLADKYNVLIKLYVTNIYGTDLNVLYEFYKKHGFFLIKDNNDGHMIYKPKNYKKIVTNLE
jgi:GNAT superfamily N-acetyltransferase